MSTYPSFLEHIRGVAGTRNWVLARRTSRIVARYGEDVYCFTQQSYQRVRAEWAAGHPATLLVDTLPEGEEKQFIREAVQARLW